MVFNKLIVFLITYLYHIRCSEGLKCGHSELQKTIEIKTTDLGSYSERFLKTAEWEPIRIYIDYTNLNSQLGMVSATLINNLKNTMFQAVYFIQQLINVKRTASPLLIKSCNSNISISSQVSQIGVTADLVIFPYFDIIYDDSPEAASAVCNVDLSTGRPLAGFIGFKKDFDFTKINALFDKTVRAMHQLTHILGFSGYMFGSFIDNNGNKQPYNKIVTSSNVNGKHVQMIKTPKVLSIARNYFNCPSLIGVELEDQGGAKIPGSHWESRIMYGDYMIGTEIAENVISEITLGLLEDSGWYQANYYTGGLFRFGKQKGCSFLNSQCVNNNQTTFSNEYPITQGQAYTCFAGRTAKGIADLISNPNPLPTWFQYYSDPTYGGFELADFCPVTVDYDMYGWYDAGSCSMGQSTYAPGLGETIGSDSSCFYSSLTYINDTSLNSYTNVTLPVCFEIACNYTKMSYDVYIRDVTFDCSSAGGAISVSGFDGTFYCADFNLVCTQTVQCGNVLNCIAKQSLLVEPNYDYVPQDSVETIDLNSFTLDSINLSYSLFTVLLAIFVIMFEG